MRAPRGNCHLPRRPIEVTCADATWRGRGKMSRVSEYLTGETFVYRAGLAGYSTGPSAGGDKASVLPDGG